ncbi:hypothetical protein [Streptomyces sp. NPDC006610]|jgi:hypothetical protein|uniref:hypothetical protein n=1 Tax=Streptomyces sp. NPDC006610 TaxID=3154584 RepID=UPI0033A658BD
MDYLTAAVTIVAITATTAVLVVRTLSSAPARIAVALGAVAVLFAVVPRIIEPLSTPSAPAPTATVTVEPAAPGGAAPAASPSVTPDAGAARGVPS